jgi:hypothetical protein
MSEPILFISHFRIKEGALESVKEITRDVTEQLQREKPQTLLFLSYLDEAGEMISFLHAFADSDAMDVHSEGSDERAEAAYEYVEPAGWEFYGNPSPTALEGVRQAAASAGVTLSVQPHYLSGFLRLVPR